MEAKAEKYILHGKALFEGRDFEAAYAQLSQAIYILEEDDTSLWMNPEEMAELYLLRGSALYKDSEGKIFNDPDLFAQIIEDYDQAISFQPDNSLYYRMRGYLYLNCKFEDYKREAKEDFKAAINANKNDAPAHRLMGEALSKEEEYEKAIFYFTQSLAIQKEAEIYMLRGVCHFRKAVPDFTSAAQDFGEAQKQLPKLEELYIWRAQCFQELGDFTSAIEEYDRLVEIAPGNASHLIDRGTIKYAIDPEDAFSDFNKALEITVHPLALNNRAYYYLQQGDYDSAIEDAKMALEVDSNYSIAYATLAEIYATQGDRKAFYHFLELAKQHYYEDIIDIMMEPAFAPYTAEPRFLKIIGKD